MTFLGLIRRNLLWYWRTNLAVILGVAVAIGVLAGSLLVGTSVRASLRRIAVERLGNTDVAILPTHFVRESLASDLAERQKTRRVRSVPLIALDAVAVVPGEQRRLARVQVFGVDDRFWRFHGVAGVSGPSGREAFLSPSLADELALAPGDTLLLRVQKPSDIPAGVLQGRREDVGQTLRTTVGRTLTRASLGEFSLAAGQAPVRAVFVSIDRLQREIDQPDRANVILAAGDARQPNLAQYVDRAFAEVARPEDLGVIVKPLPQAGALSVEGSGGFIDPAVQPFINRAAAAVGEPVPVLTYIANTIRIRDRTIPYSVVTATHVARLQPRIEPPTEGELPPIWLNEWAARELGAARGDTVALDYFLWSDEGGLTTASRELSFAGTVPMTGIGGDPSFTPDYPGMTSAAHMGDWDPPFPVDLARIQPRDERYWDQYRTSPKAFLRYEDGRRMWASRFGDVTSVRIVVPQGTELETARGRVLQALDASITPANAGLVAHPVRARALAAARGSTDFGEYFFYFSFFLFVGGLVLAGLFFRLGVEQRLREIGVLRAVGYTSQHISRVFLTEGVLLAAAGAVVGVPAALAFCWLVLAGLRTWWIGAVGTDQLELSVEWGPLAIGAMAGLGAAVLTTYVSVRALRHATARGLMAGGVRPVGMRGRRRSSAVIGSLVCLAVALLVAAGLGRTSTTASFFSAGGALLVAGMLAFSSALRRAPGRPILAAGALSVLRLGVRQTRWRPGRSVLVAGLIAAATFVIVAVGAFRREQAVDMESADTGVGGFSFLAESIVPVMHDPGTSKGRQELGLSADEDRTFTEVHIWRFRLRPGDEASCLNLYRPSNPRIMAPEQRVLRERRFAFGETMAATDAERHNPWLLLNRTFEDGAVPAIADATSLAYALHTPVGGDLTVPGPEGRPVVLRIVAALEDSLFQSELLIAERDFLRLFPRNDGFRFFLIDPPAARSAAVVSTFEERLGDYGLDVEGTGERLAAYHRVEQTYLSTFQTLGGLGLILGTLGLGTVLLRNVIERRRELALLSVVGYRAGHVRAMVMAESLLLLGAGVIGGSVTAVLAVTPALLERGAGPAWVHTSVLLACVIVAGLASTVVAARAATRRSPLAALRSE
jgi:putative ABC transport system permease protein